MLPFFPGPYQDELLLSVLSRYHDLSGNHSYKHSMEDLFGSRTVTAVAGLPGRLDALCAHLVPGSTLTADRLIQDHTLFPLYRPFLAQPQAERAVRMMKGSSGGGVHTTVGAMASSVPSETHLRYCPRCVEDDRQEFGEGYWHRSHQVFGVDLCHKHLVPLGESPVAISARQNKYALISLESANCVAKGQVLPSGEGFDDQKYLSHAVAWLLTNEVPVLGLAKLRRRYISCLQAQELATAGGCVRQQALLERFRQRFGLDYLARIGCGVDPSRQDCWVSKLLRAPRSSAHPLKHLLLMGFLDVSPREFLQSVGQAFPARETRGKDINSAHACVDSSYEKNKYRSEWLVACEAQGGTGVSSVRCCVPRVYTWLYRHDRRWLRRHLPAPVTREEAPAERVDWTSRDARIAVAVDAAARDLKMRPGKPARVTTSLLGKATGELALLQRHLDRLPLTREVLSQCTESIIDFQARRIRYVAAEMRRAGVSVTKWRLERLAGLKPGYPEQVLKVLQEETGVSTTHDHGSTPYCRLAAEQGRTRNASLAPVTNTIAGPQPAMDDDSSLPPMEWLASGCSGPLGPDPHPPLGEPLL